MRDNAAIVRRWFEEVWNQRRAETIFELMAADGICQGDGVSLQGPDQFQNQQFAPLIAAFPDLQVTLERMICEGDDVAVLWSATGHHTGESLELQPTGRQVTLRGMSWIVIRDGKLQGGWQRSNIREVIGGLKPDADQPVQPPAPSAPF